MDEFKQFWKSMTIKERQRFAEDLPTTFGYMQRATHTADSLFGPAICVAIEKKTDGKFSRQMLRPHDWKAIWPELVQEAA